MSNKSITIETSITNQGNLILTYLMGKWRFMTIVVIMKPSAIITAGSEFTDPKYAGGESRRLEIGLDQIPDKREAFSVYKRLKRKHDLGLAHLRIEKAKAFIKCQEALILDSINH
jgi:hypothetical protein